MKTKDKIVNSLCKLMENNTFENITVKEITQNANVNRSTYYRNFNSKEDIIQYKLQCILDEYIENFEKEENKSKKNYIHIILSTFLKYKEFFIIIHKQNQSYILQKTLTEYFKVNSKELDKKELYESYYHIGGIYNFLICWIESGIDEDISELAEIGAELTTNINSLYEYYI